MQRDRPSTRSSRSFHLVLTLVLSGCCSAAAGAAASAPTIGPIAATSNGGGGAGGGAGAIPTPSGASRYTLWCARPGGPACTQAASALGVSATDTAAIPQVLLEQIRDTENDCEDTDVASVTGILAGPLGITARNFHDNVGGALRRESVAQTFSGGGCTNCCFAPNEPAVKIHVVATPNGVQFLVRVWEIGAFANAC